MRCGAGGRRQGSMAMRPRPSSVRPTARLCFRRVEMPMRRRPPTARQLRCWSRRLAPSGREQLPYRMLWAAQLPSARLQTMRTSRFISSASIGAIGRTVYMILAMVTAAATPRTVGGWSCECEALGDSVGL